MRLITLLSVLMETEVDGTSQFRLNGSRMNRVELDEALHGQPKWAAFARKLEKAMTEEYRLDGFTLVLREPFAVKQTVLTPICWHSTKRTKFLSLRSIRRNTFLPR